MDVFISRLMYGLLFFLVSYPHVQEHILFQRDFSSAEELVNRYEKDFRDVYPIQAKTSDFTRYVDPYIGSGGHGNKPNYDFGNL